MNCARLTQAGMVPSGVRYVHGKIPRMQGRINQQDVAAEDDVAFRHEIIRVLFGPANEQNQESKKAKEKYKADRGRGKSEKLSGSQQCNLREPWIKDFVGVRE